MYQMPESEPETESTPSEQQIADAHALLVRYPFVSATPISHVARHLDHMSSTAPIPSVAQPHLFPGNHISMANPPPYAHLPPVLDALTPPEGPARELWDSQRGVAINALEEESRTIPFDAWSHPIPPRHAPLNADTKWQKSAYQSSALATTILRSVHRHRSAPMLPSGLLPPPSSLANALGNEAHSSQQHQFVPSNRPFHPSQSLAFFDEFLEKTLGSQANPSLRPSSESRPTTDFNNQLQSDLLRGPLERLRTPVRTPPAIETPNNKPAELTPRPPLPQESPDPLSLVPGASKETNGAAITPTRPAKRKADSAFPTSRVSVVITQLPPGSSSRPGSLSSKGSSTTLSFIGGKDSLSPSVKKADRAAYTDIDEATPWTSRITARDTPGRSKKTLKLERDAKVPLQKFMSYLEEIFEAEDSLPLDADKDHRLSPAVAAHFSHLMTSFSEPLLHSNSMQRLVYLLNQLAHPSKRSRVHQHSSQARSEPIVRLSQVDAASLQRLLRMLGRTVELGSGEQREFAPFDWKPLENSAATTQKTPQKSPKKRKKEQTIASSNGKNTNDNGRSSRSRSRSRSKTREPDKQLGGDNVSIPDSKLQGVPDILPIDEAAKFDRELDIASECALAVECCLSLLTADALPKQVYSEELISSCMMAIKNLLTYWIYPFVEATSEIQGTQGPVLSHIVRSLSHEAIARRNRLGNVFRTVSSIFPRIDALLGMGKPSNAHMITMSDSIVIMAAYISIGPFFVVEPGTVQSKAKDKVREKVILGVQNVLGGEAGFRALRLSALSVIRTIFEGAPGQRDWIVEEILTSLLKLPDINRKAGQFKLRDGQSIHTISALLLQLIQTSACDVGVHARRIRSERRKLMAQLGGVTQKMPPSYWAEVEEEELKLSRSALDSPSKVAKTVVLYLKQRAGSSKASKNSNEADYRAILDNLISDILRVLHWSEWPGASLLLMVFCRVFTQILEDVKSSAGADLSSLKSIALDNLGQIAARLRESQLRVARTPAGRGEGKYDLDNLIRDSNVSGLETLISAHEEILSVLTGLSTKEDAGLFESARVLSTTIWFSELGNAFQRCDSIISQMANEGKEAASEKAQFQAFADRIKRTLQHCWDEPNVDVFGPTPELAATDVLTERVGTSQLLRNGFHLMLGAILASLDAPAVFMRTKALRALGQIVVVDNQVLRDSNVKRAIENHLRDSSSAVREAAVELIGKYLTTVPEVASEYFSQILERIADTGLGVRKRVIKLLRNMYFVEASLERRINICYRLIMRALDEDETVKDLSIKTISELWFGGQEVLNAPSGGNSSIYSLNTKVTVVMSVCTKFSSGLHSPLEIILTQLTKDAEGTSESPVLSQFSQICDLLIDALVDANLIPGFSIANCIRTLFVFTSAYPRVISSAKAQILIPYLKNPSNPEELAISDYILKIFRLSIPTFPKTAIKFGQELQPILQPIIKGSSGGLATLQEAVACHCATVKFLTNDYRQLVFLLKSCNEKVKSLQSQAANTSLPETVFRHVTYFAHILSSLCENVNFEELRQSGFVRELDLISKNSIPEHVYMSLLSLYESIKDESTRSRLMNCFGSLFRSNPSLMTSEESASLMETVFSSSDLEARCRLLKTIHSFLLSESAKFESELKANSEGNNSNVKMEELVGNTAGFAEGSVSSAVVQRYLTHVLEAAMTIHAALQNIAIDILGFVVRQGLAHPIQCIPTIIALETSPSSSLSSRALAYHKVLYDKHATMINTRFMDCAKKTFEYQTRLLGSKLSEADSTESVDYLHGLRADPVPTALFRPWYTLVREKRTTRVEWLKSLVKSIDVDIEIGSGYMSQTAFDFLRYMIENFSALDYKTQEELLLVIRHTTVVLSVTGTQVVDGFVRKRRGAHQASDGAPVTVIESSDNSVVDEIPLQPEFSRTAASIMMLLVLKAYLKELYGLSEEKCTKWSSGKKSAIGDKPAIRRHENPISWEKIPCALKSAMTHDDAEHQYSRLLEMWDQEGVSPEPLEDID
ncbi:uncharacterized protein EI90DRAFT_2994571 [Cantharellus anzutake]|uniref:uncharacterized protein n=1 Tax=Cantharellus anzutake TaxID=1750568 RepID=UPI0019046938|nr:uncharacterized protein EI90DRAFT_2994571 [Cantharellus anzutake]KAF8333610.1 hypothetical protein EI90DRAFT_2994571 [Cantharellus anzutake]